MDNKEFAQVLRKLADVYETHDALPLLSNWQNSGTEWIFTHNVQDLANVVLAFGSKFGKLIKHSDHGGIWFTPEQLPNLRIWCYHKAVCERVVVGEKIIPAQPEVVIPAQPEVVIPAQPERVEKLYEWKCPDSILAAAKAPDASRPLGLLEPIETSEEILF